MKQLKQVSYIQGHGYPTANYPYGDNGGEVGFTDGSFVWFSKDMLNRLEPNIGDGLMVDRPLWRKTHEL